MSLYIDNYDIVYLTKKFKNGKEQKGYNVESHINGKNVHDLKKIIPLAESFLDTNKNNYNGYNIKLTIEIFEE